LEAEVKPSGSVGALLRRPRARRGECAELVEREVAVADHVVDAREVRPVEEVEALERQLEEFLLAEVEAAREPRVEAVEGLAEARVAPRSERAVGLRAAVVVHVDAHEQVERAARVTVRCMRARGAATSRKRTKGS
jgi:hypothetical protein